jgi:hypothetical protein
MKGSSTRSNGDGGVVTPESVIENDYRYWGRLDFAVIAVHEARRRGSQQGRGQQTTPCREHRGACRAHGSRRDAAVDHRSAREVRRLAARPRPVGRRRRPKLRSDPPGPRAVAPASSATARRDSSGRWLPQPGRPPARTGPGRCALERAAPPDPGQRARRPAAGQPAPPPDAAAPRPTAIARPITTPRPGAAAGRGAGGGGVATDQAEHAAAR